MFKEHDKKFECIPLQWDTEYFNVKSARVNLNGIVDISDQDEIIEFFKDYDFITVFNRDNLHENNQWIGIRTHAFLTDINIQFSKILKDVPNFQDERTYVLSNLPRNIRIVEIAQKAFNYSRFFNDLKLPETKAKNIYLHWIECAFEQESKHFVITERNGNIAGFILFSFIEDQSVVELIAVDEKYQRLGVGKSLIYSMESFVIDKGIHKIKVGTQVNNIDAIRFYSTLGFSYNGCASIYHLWSE